jgi:endonuclease/exonuclease/phosphatase family metal-dependent hydrolase
MVSRSRQWMRRTCVAVGVLALGGAFALRVRATTRGAPLLLRQEVSPLRVLTWNVGKIYLGKQVDSRAADQDLWRIAEVIRQTQPRLIALQELRDGDQLQRLITQLGPGWVGHISEREINDRRAAVIVRAEEGISFSQVVTSTGRSIAIARLPCGARQLSFASVHLDAFSPVLRRTQAEEILDWASRTGDRDIILAGDFNFDADFLTSHEPENTDLGVYHLLTAHFEDAGHGGGGTTIYDRRLDYQFFRGRLRPRSVHVVSDKTANLMDHLPVLVDFELAPSL